jgi:twitching motility protein PilT
MNGELAAIRLHELLINARARGASDVHFGGGHRCALRIDGRLILLDGLDGEPTPAATVMTFLESRLDPASRARLAQRGTADGVWREARIGSYRIHAYRAFGGVRVAIRLLALDVPQLATLGLPPVIASFAAAPLGLVLFTGPTGSGKTTALAALIDTINRTRERTIVTIEDPLEYLHAPIRSLIAHCEVGRDVSDFAEALRGALRADPDVILVGEMRDRETIAAALTAAETGHLVFSTLHTNDAAQTIDRVVDVFPSEAQQQVRAQLASVLRATVALRLLPRAGGPGRRAAAEVLTATEGVRAMIREGKTHQLRNAIVTGRAAGMQTLEAHLSDLVGRGEISLEAAQAVSSRPLEIAPPARGVA